MPPIIKLEDVDFYYDRGQPSEVHALKTISLDIAPGEYVSFFGPSGCGKSTILYAIAGVERPTSGNVIINGENLSNFAEKDLAVFRQVGIGIIFQNFNLIPSIRNIDNVILPMSFLGISPEKRRKRAMELLERLGLAALAERYPHELSGGQQQRVAIARALANDPPLILADEPIGNLDSQNAVNVLDLLKEFNTKDGKTIIIVTHEAWSLRDVDRIFYMRDGAITKIEARHARAAQSSAAKYKKLYPELPSVENRARALSNLILRGFTDHEIKRFEFFLAQRLRNAIDGDLFMEILDRPYAKGGVGLWKQKARRISDHVDKIIREQKEITAIYKKFEERPEDPLLHDVERFRRWLVDGVPLSLSSLQVERLDECINERLRKIITPDHFIKVLSLPRSRGGLGFQSHLSLRLAEKFEGVLQKESEAAVAL